MLLIRYAFLPITFCCNLFLSSALFGQLAAKLKYNDTILCSGSTITLEANKADTYEWQPSKNLDDTHIRTPTFTADSTRTYHVITNYFSNNLIKNGDFEQGNNGFSSAYKYCNTSNCLFPEGYYAVGKNPTFFQLGFLAKTTHQDQETL